MEEARARTIHGLTTGAICTAILLLTPTGARSDVVDGLARATEADLGAVLRVQADETDAFLARQAANLAAAAGAIESTMALLRQVDVRAAAMVAALQADTQIGAGQRSRLERQVELSREQLAAASARLRDAAAQIDGAGERLIAPRMQGRFASDVALIALAAAEATALAAYMQAFSAGLADVLQR